VRQNRPFPRRPQPAPAPPPPPTTRLEKLRQRIHRFYTRFRTVFIVAAIFLIAYAATFAYDLTKPSPQHLTQRDINAAFAVAMASATPQPAFSAKVYAAISPSLVTVHAIDLTTNGKKEGALGTGVVIDESGVILTSLHIIKNAIEVRVTFYDGTESTASVIATQPENDLAVLRASTLPDDLQAATLAPSSSLRVGDNVVAVGNPFGITSSLSAGVVSGLNRNFKSPKTGDTINNLIQFDAAVNPGNSGGPLLNRDGEVVGIVTALLNPTDQEVFIGIGFAVPIETALSGAGTPDY